MTKIEIKARIRKYEKVIRILTLIQAVHERTEKQLDTYFSVDNGRLKLREIDGHESKLIQYFRNQDVTPKQCNYAIVRVQNADKFGRMLSRVHGIYQQVSKVREYWTWNQVNIHLDQVDELGSFIEFEAIVGNFQLHMDAEDKFIYLMSQFNIQPGDVLHTDYAEMVTGLDTGR